MHEIKFKTAIRDWITTAEIQTIPLYSAILSSPIKNKLAYQVFIHQSYYYLGQPVYRVIQNKMS